MFAIVAAGQVGGRAAITLRKKGFSSRIVLVGNESYPSYERPTVSKGILTGDAAPESAYLRSLDRFRELDIDLRLSVSAERLDTANYKLILSTGEELQYERSMVLIAIGIEPNIELASQAGLAIDNAILVDSSDRTSMCLMRRRVKVDFNKLADVTVAIRSLR